MPTPIVSARHQSRDSVSNRLAVDTVVLVTVMTSMNTIASPCQRLNEKTARAEVPS